MTRVSRSRSRSVPYRGSYVMLKQDGSVSSGPFMSTITHLSTCNDTTGRPIQPSPFQSVQSVGVMRLHGKVLNDANSLMYVYDDYPFISGNGEPIDGSLLPVKYGWLLDLVAGTNPSRPVFTPPQMLQDLIELPRLLRDTGRLLRKPSKLFSPREAANAHLAGRFGWTPLIEDLMKLLDLQSIILKRNRELQNLYSGQGLRRRLRFGEDNRTFKTVHNHAQYGSMVISCDIHTTVKKEQWGTIRWKPTSPPPFAYGDEGINSMARRLVFGLTVEGMAKGAWDVIPWTWLLGWFTNVGKFALAHSNTVPAQYYGACLMNKVAVTSVPGMVSVKGSKQFKIVPSGFYQKTTRTRSASSGTLTPGFNMPYLDMSRLSILGSLFIQRMR